MKNLLNHKQFLPILTLVIIGLLILTSFIDVPYVTNVLGVLAFASFVGVIITKTIQSKKEK